MAFTLVEMLVGTAVLVLIMVMAVQFVALASRSTINDRKKIDALSQARQALDRFGLDWRGRVVRNDVAVAFSKKAGNDELAFVTQVASPGANRPLSAVDYRIDPDTGRLERGSAGYSWSGGLSPAFPITVLPAPDASSYQSLGRGTFRLEFALLSRADGTSASKYWAPAGETWQVASVTNLAAVCVAVAVLDDASLKIVSTAQLKQLSQALPDVPAGDPVAAWKAAVNRPDFARDAGVPDAVGQAVRIYGRYYHVVTAP